MLIWITGLSGSGKTTIANEVYKRLKKENKNTVLLDGDIIRKALNHNWGYSLEERHRGARCVAGLCWMLEAEDLIVVCATMSLFHEIQRLNRKKINDFIEVYLDVKIEVLIKRDPKGLYHKALNGLEKNVVGIDVQYEKPKNPELTLSNAKLEELDSNVEAIIMSAESLLTSSKKIS